MDGSETMALPPRRVSPGLEEPSLWRPSGYIVRSSHLQRCSAPASYRALYSGAGAPGSSASLFSVHPWRNGDRDLKVLTGSSKPRRH